MGIGLKDHTTGIKRGIQTISLGIEDIYDKVINVKFIRKDGTYFVIRSDYEVYYDTTSAHTAHFIRCRQKPQIKVSYKQVSSAVAIKVDIEVTNLFIDGGPEAAMGVKASSPAAFQTSLEQAEGNPITWAVIQMGYINQFPDWTKEPRASDTGYLDRFYEMNNSGLTSEREVWNMRQIQVMVLTTQSRGNPPDKVTYFQGIIGTMEDGLRWTIKPEDLARNFGSGNVPVVNPVTGEGYSEIEAALFVWITRRFLRASVIHEVITIEEPFEQRVLIYGFKDYSKSVPEGIVVPKPDTSYTELTLEDNGLMREVDAQQFGVLCSCSQKLRTLTEHTKPRYALDELAREKLGDPPAIPVCEQHTKLGAQLNAIQKVYEFLRWYERVDGSFYVYHVEEDEDDLFHNPEVRNSKTHVLSAIYDMEFSGTRTIRCPFFSFFSPMDKLIFSSRYVISDLVGYYYHPTGGNDAFLALLVSISFDTTGDENMMEIMAVDIDKSLAKVTDDNEIEWLDEVPPVELPSRDYNKQWTKSTVTVTKDPSAGSSWSQIAKNHWIPTAKQDKWPNGVPALAQAVETIKQFNIDNRAWFNPDGTLADLKQYGAENRSVGTLSDVPWLHVGDVVKLNIPALPDYPADQEAV